jgi:amino acid transporter
MMIGTLVIMWKLQVSLFHEKLTNDISVDKLGGSSFKMFMALVGMGSALGLFNARLCATSWALSVFLKDLGFNLFAKMHSKFRTPWVAIIFTSSITAMFISLPFQILVEIDVLLYSMGLLLQFGALFMLRLKEPNMQRPYRYASISYQTLF